MALGIVDIHAIYYPGTRPIRGIVSMTLLEWLFIFGALGGFVCTFYCQIKACNNISRKKVEQHKDPQQALKGAIPSKTILNDKGLKYLRGFYIGVGLSVVCMFGFILAIVFNSFPK